MLQVLIVTCPPTDLALAPTGTCRDVLANDRVAHATAVGALPTDVTDYGQLLELDCEVGYACRGGLCPTVQCGVGGVDANDWSAGAVNGGSCVIGEWRCGPVTLRCFSGACLQACWAHACGMLCSCMGQAEHHLGLLVYFMPLTPFPLPAAPLHLHPTETCDTAGAHLGLAPGYNAAPYSGALTSVPYATSVALTCATGYVCDAASGGCPTVACGAGAEAWEWGSAPTTGACVPANGGGYGGNYGGNTNTNTNGGLGRRLVEEHRALLNAGGNSGSGAGSSSGARRRMASLARVQAAKEAMHAMAAAQQEEEDEVLVSSLLDTPDDRAMAAVRAAAKKGAAATRAEAAAQAAKPLEVMYGTGKDDTVYEVFAQAMGYEEAVAFCAARRGARPAGYVSAEQRVFVDMMCDASLGMTCWVDSGSRPRVCSFAEDGGVWQGPCGEKRQPVCVRAL